MEYGKQRKTDECDCSGKNEMFQIHHGNITLLVNPNECAYTLAMGKDMWRFCDDSHIKMRNGDVIYLRDGMCSAHEVQTGISHGIDAIYTGLHATAGTPYAALVIHTNVSFDNDTGDLRFFIRVQGDEYDAVETLFFPGAVEYDAAEGEGYTVLSQGQGLLYFAGQKIQMGNGYIFSRDSYLPLYAQTRLGGGYLAIFETPYDAQFQPVGPRGDWLQPMWRPSMGRIRYPRCVLYRFFDREEKLDYVRVAKEYRAYVRTNGTMVTLQEKFVCNPNAQYMIGAPLIHFDIVHNYKPNSRVRPEGAPMHSCVPFAVRAKELRALHDRGLQKAYIHTDGWGVMGYDNQHPDIFPVSEEAGGADGMRDLSDTCRALGYRFGVHDQYRDYYLDAKSFSYDNAVVSPNGQCPWECMWEGGEQVFLCATKAPAYVRRNYREFARLGIGIDGAYLDVFSVADLDECVHPDHPMTREECAMYRRQCIRYLNQNHIISASEEVSEFLVPDLILCHWAPYTAVGLEEFDRRVPVPLFNLVYHDCIIIPWCGLGTMVAGQTDEYSYEWGYLHALLNAGTFYVKTDATEKELSDLKPLMALHEKVGMLEMTDHTFIDGDYAVQQTTFADGTRVQVNYRDNTYSICDGEHA